MQSSRPERSPNHGAYYKFSWNDDDDASSDDGNPDVNYRERVDRILRETELHEQVFHDPELQEPWQLKSSLDNLPELSSLSSLEVISDISSTPATSSKSSSLRSSRVATPVLESPLDHPDSGYIDFLTSPSSSGSPDNIFTLNNSDLSCTTRQMRPDANVTKFRPTAIRFTKCNFSKLKEDSYMDDEMQTYAFTAVPSSGGLHKYDNSSTDVIPAESETAFVLPLCEDQDSLPDADPYQYEVADTDTNPILVLDQSSLLQEWDRRRRRRLLVTVVTVTVICGVAAAAAIIYLVLHFMVIE